jgi:hypothetical protein
MFQQLSAAQPNQPHTGMPCTALTTPVLLRRYALEQRIEKALEELKRKKAAKEAK